MHGWRVDKRGGVAADACSRPFGNSQACTSFAHPANTAAEPCTSLTLTLVEEKVRASLLPVRGRPAQQAARRPLAARQLCSARRLAGARASDGHGTRPGTCRRRRTSAGAARACCRLLWACRLIITECLLPHCGRHSGRPTARRRRGGPRRRRSCQRGESLVTRRRHRRLLPPHRRCRQRRSGRSFHGLRGRSTHLFWAEQRVLRWVGGWGVGGG